MKSLICLLLFVSSLAVHAQSKNNQHKKLHIAGNVAAGLLLGDSDYGYTLKGTAGVGFKQMRLGLGAGYDHYWYRTYPLFATASVDLLKRWRLLAEGGINLPEQRLLATTPWSTTRLSNGGYGGGYICYQIKSWKKQTLFVSGGYSIKTLNVTEKSNSSWEFTTEKNYRFNRAVLQLAFEF